MNAKRFCRVLAWVLCAVLFAAGIVCIPIEAETSTSEVTSATESDVASSETETSSSTSSPSSAVSSHPSSVTSATPSSEPSQAPAPSLPEESSAPSQTTQQITSSRPAASVAGNRSSDSSDSSSVSSQADEAQEPQLSPYWDEELESLLNQTCSYLSRTDAQQSGLYFLALSSAGKSISIAQVTGLTDRLSSKNFSEEDKLQQAYDILNLTFCGYSAANFQGENLITLLYDVPDLNALTFEELCYCLLALDSNQYTIPSESSFTRSDLCQSLLAYQQEDGGFAPADGEASDSYFTALALTTLAGYQSKDSEVAAALQHGLQFLSQQQGEDGAVLENDTPSCQATAQTIIALCALDVDLRAPRFTQNGRTLFHGLQQFLCTNGGFSETEGFSTAQLDSTQMAILALAALKKDASPYVVSVLFSSEAAAIEAEETPQEDNYVWIWVLGIAGVAVIGAAAGWAIVWRRKKKKAVQTNNLTEASVPNEPSSDSENKSL